MQFKVCMAIILYLRTNVVYALQLYMQSSNQFPTHSGPPELLHAFCRLRYWPLLCCWSFGRTTSGVFRMYQTDMGWVFLIGDLNSIYHAATVWTFWIFMHKVRHMAFANSLRELRHVHVQCGLRGFQQLLWIYCIGIPRMESRTWWIYWHLRAWGPLTYLDRSTCIQWRTYIKYFSSIRINHRSRPFGIDWHWC